MLLEMGGGPFHFINHLGHEVLRKIGDFLHFLPALASDNQFILKLVDVAWWYLHVVVER